MAQRSKKSLQDLTDLTGSLYAASAQPDLWPAALDQIGDALGGAALVTSFHRPGGMAFMVNNRLDPEADKVLREHYSKPATNPLFAAMPRIPVLSSVSRESVMDDEGYFRSGLFNDVFRAQGFVHAGLSCLAREDRIVIPCGVLRRANRDFDTKCFRLYEAILPHLRRALELTVRISDLHTARQQAEAVANAVEDGYVVTDASGRVLYANTLAERVLSAGDGLSCRSGILAAARSEETARLHRFITAAALRSDHLGGNMRITRVAKGVPWALVVMPATDAFAGATPLRNGGYTSMALVRLIDLEQKTPAPAARLMEFFGFSRAEAIIAAGLMEGSPPEEIAERRNLKITTIRTHIRSIYLKTGTSRQTQLVRLLLRAAGPSEKPCE